jgi:class 3 adenylate cyclase
MQHELVEEAGVEVSPDGTVLAREGDVFGRAVNLASRLVVRARPGSMLVDAATKEALDDRFATSALAPLRLSGIGSMRCWRVRRRSDDRS